MYEKILLATDNSKQAEKAGKYVISMTKMSGADIIVLYVIDTYDFDIPQKDLKEQLEKQLREEGKEAIEKFEKQLEEEQCAGSCKNVNLINVIKVGKPADVIIETAEEEGVNQIIIGKSGKNALEKFLLGSTAEKVVRGSKIPVNVIS